MSGGGAMIAQYFSASCDGCGSVFSASFGSHFSDRDALLVALGASRWGIVFGDTSDIETGSVVCAYCRGVDPSQEVRS